VERIRILLVDDHALVRAGLRAVLAAEADIEVVGEAASGEEALRLARALHPDVVLMDLQMPGMSGLAATEHLVRSGLSRVVVVTALGDAPFPRRVLELGALGFVVKAGPAEELLAAVRAAARGRRFLARAVAEQLALAALDGHRSPLEKLSRRELEVASKLAEGLGQTEIARQLHLSVKTVQTYKTRVFEKLAVDSVVALARLLDAYRGGSAG
jgi:DNA-binding NarL/FixJ family response regulator